MKQCDENKKLKIIIASSKVLSQIYRNSKALETKTDKKVVSKENYLIKEEKQKLQ